MKKIIELNKQGIGRLKINEPFLLPDEIELNFIAKGYDLSNAFISLQNGENSGVLRLSNPFNVPDEYLHAGYLNMRVEMYIGDKVAKRWDIMPIKIYEVPSGTEMKDYLGELEEKLAEQQERIARLEKQNEIIK